MQKKFRTKLSFVVIADANFIYRNLSQVGGRCKRECAETLVPHHIATATIPQSAGEENAKCIAAFRISFRETLI